MENEIGTVAVDGATVLGSCGRKAVWGVFTFSVFSYVEMVKSVTGAQTEDGKSCDTRTHTMACQTKTKSPFACWP